MNQRRDPDPLGIVHRLIADLPDGASVNLGIGLPIRALEAWGDDPPVLVHSENGILGMRALRPDEAPDADLTNAAKHPVGLIDGGCFFEQTLSFAIMRGGHLDYSVLGAYQVSNGGDIANWSLDEPDQADAVGGAMDLVVGAKQIFAVMRHLGPDGDPRLVQECTLPVTGRAVINRVYTDLATIDIDGDGFVLRDLAPGVTTADVTSATGAPIRIPDHVLTQRKATR